jgi:hypothetical protein
MKQDEEQKNGETRNERIAKFQQLFYFFPNIYQKTTIFAEKISEIKRWND